MRRWVLCLFFAGYALNTWGQQPSYFYGNREIVLSSDNETVAATLHPSVSLEKYPKVALAFRSLQSSLIRPDSSILVARRSTSQTTASAALDTALKRKEASLLPVYKIGELKLVLQNEIIVQFKHEVSKESSSELLRKFSSLFVELRPDSGTFLVRVGNPEATLRISNLLRGNSNIAFAEPNFVVIQPKERTNKRWEAPEVKVSNSGPLSASIPSPNVPTDPLFSRQWALSNRIQDEHFGKSGSDIGILKAWQITKGSDKIRVAVLDEGVDTNHPDLKGSIATGDDGMVEWDAILESNQQQPAGSDSHGTLVAGIIAAQINNGIGIVGVAPGVKIIPIRVGTRADSPDGTWTTPVIVDSAIRKAVEFRADVINVSWSIDPSKLVSDAIAYAESAGREGKGIVVVCSAGNDGGNVVFPASLAGPNSGVPVIAVGASNSWDEVKTRASRDREDWWASNAGPALTVVAPGVGVATTDLNGSSNASGGSYVFNFDGTSSAAPFVSGVAALLLSIHSGWTASQIRDKITQTAARKGTSRTDAAGWGRVDACRALEAQNCT
jgi:thermitase